ncbi:hypothetical protein, partial [Mycobacterium tuberculosis]|uniref:hypothetical protein n=1 Tax=Mycobacterium tuberculosis TaxID=1773 RepID=UPI00254C1577
EYAQRLARERRNLLAISSPSVGASLFAGALVGGARALGISSGIAPGASADFFSLDADHPAVWGRHGNDLLDGWIFASRSDAVDCVWQAGRKV